MNSLISRLLLSCCALASLANAAEPVAASAPAKAASAPATVAVPSKAAVDQAIAVLEKDFLSDKAPAAADTVLQFVQESKDVRVQLSPKTTPWIFGNKSADAKENNLRFMLLVAYMAGNSQAQLKTGKTADNPLAGWQFALKSYEALKRAHKVKIAELETLKAQQAKGQLSALAKTVLQP